MNNKKLLIICITIVCVFTCLNGCGDNSESSKSHENCMFLGYADPNRPLKGSTIILQEPKYGYRPVYVDRDDIYNTYHFH